MVRAGHQKDKPSLEPWNFQPIPHSPEKGEVKMELIIDCVYMMKCPYKSRKYRVWSASGYVNTSTC